MLTVPVPSAHVPQPRATRVLVTGAPMTSHQRIWRLNSFRQTWRSRLFASGRFIFKAKVRRCIPRSQFECPAIRCEELLCGCVASSHGQAICCRHLSAASTHDQVHGAALQEIVPACNIQDQIFQHHGHRQGVGLLFTRLQLPSAEGASGYVLHFSQL